MSTPVIWYSGLTVNPDDDEWGNFFGDFEKWWDIDLLLESIFTLEPAIAFKAGDNNNNNIGKMFCWKTLAMI